MLKFTLPAALWFGLSVIPIIIFYFLRTRFRQQPVASIFLWSRLAEMVHMGSRVRWRTIFLLLLQVLTAISAVLALAGPMWSTRYQAKPGIIYLIDVSASMAAKDVSSISSYHSRLEQAKSLLFQEIAKQPTETEGMVILCSAGIQVLGSPTTDHKTLLGRLKTVDISSETSTETEVAVDHGQLATRLQSASITGAAFHEAEVASQLQTWLLTHQRTWRAVLITDGGLDLAGKSLANLFGGNIQTLIVGKNGNDLGVTALRLLSDGKAQFLIHNGWLQEQVVEVALEYNKRLLATAKLTVPPGVSKHILAWQGSNTPGIYRIRLVQTSDNLESDDYYYLAVNEPQAVKVLLVGNKNLFLRAALKVPGVNLTELPFFPDSQFHADEWDLIVVDHITIPKGVRANILAFETIPPEAAIRLSRPIKGELKTTNMTHPLLRYIDWSQVQIIAGYGLIVEPETQVLATVANQPIIVAVEKDGRHYIIIGTDLFHSNLGISVSFPIFIQNLLQLSVPQWNNPLAYTLTIGETSILAEQPTWGVINTNKISLERSGPLVHMKAWTTGVYEWGRESSGYYGGQYSFK